MCSGALASLLHAAGFAGLGAGALGLGVGGLCTGACAMQHKAHPIHGCDCEALKSKITEEH
jgi:hypothetical protein